LQSECRPYSLAYRLTAGPGEEGIRVIGSAPPGAVFHVRRVEVQFPRDTLSELEVALLYGELQVFPNEGVLTGDDVKYEKPVRLTCYSQDPIRLRFRNLNAAASKTCEIILEGFLE